MYIISRFVQGYFPYVETSLLPAKGYKIKAFALNFLVISFFCDKLAFRFDYLLEIKLCALMTY